MIFNIDVRYSCVFCDNFFLILINFNGVTFLLFIFVVFFYYQIKNFLFYLFWTTIDINVKDNAFSFLLKFINKIQNVNNKRLNSTLAVNIFLLYFDILGQKRNKLKTHISLLFININP